jgi:hypothetical protein
MWALFAEHGDGGLVEAWRLISVCRASCAGSKEFLCTLPGLVVCGGYTEQGGIVRDAWRLDMATLRWEPMPALLTARLNHACCAVRDTLVVLGGRTGAAVRGDFASSVEMLSSALGAFEDLPPLSRGQIFGAPAIAVDESDSAAGQVLLLGGGDDNRFVSTVHLVDLATGACAQQPDLLRSRAYPAAGRLPDGRIVCAGGISIGDFSTAEVLGGAAQGPLDAAWSWKELPAMIAGRFGCCGCVMSDGRFAVLGGSSYPNGDPVSSCERLVVDDDEHWEPMPPMHDASYNFACAAVAGCVIVAERSGEEILHISAEVYDEVRGRWLRLPCNLPHGLRCMGSALL